MHTYNFQGNRQRWGFASNADYTLSMPVQMFNDNIGFPKAHYFLKKYPCILILPNYNLLFILSSILSATDS